MRPHRWQPTRLPHPWDSPGKNTGVGCHFLLQCMKVESESEVTRSCPTLSDPMDCSPPGSSIHGIFQARVLEWGAIAFSVSHASNAQNFPSQASTICEPWTSRCSSCFRKGRGTRDQIANICWIIEKAREFQKNIYFCFIDYAKAFDCVDHNKLWKFWKRWEYQTTWPASWEICMQVRKQQLELDMEQTGSKSRKDYVKAVYCHPAYLTYMQSTSWETLGWMKHKQAQDRQEKYQ